MSDDDKPQPDRAQGAARGTRPRPRTPALTPRRRRLAELRVGDPLAPEGRLMVAAGFATATARNPGANLPVGQSVALARRVLAEEAEGDPQSLHDLKGLALRTLKSVLSDRDEPGSTRASAAGGVLKLANEIGEAPATGDADRYRADQFRRLARTADLAARMARTGRGPLGWTAESAPPRRERRFRLAVAASPAFETVAFSPRKDAR